MRRVLLLVAAATLGPAITADENDVERARVATFNAHYLLVGSDDQLTGWAEREYAVLAVLREIDADIVAFQEMETFAGGHANRENRQADSVRAAFPTHRFTATGDPAVFPNTQPILYRADRWAPGEQGFFFFSPTPDVPYSSSWYGRYPSFASWARLIPPGEHREEASASPPPLLVVNVHIDRTRYRNQLLSARLLAERIAEIRRPGDEVILLGDFNAFQRSRVLRIATGASWTAKAPDTIAGYAPLRPVSPRAATFHFYLGLHLFPAIDHILVSEGLVSRGARVVRRRPGGVWPSDHYPVVVELTAD